MSNKKEITPDQVKETIEKAVAFGIETKGVAFTDVAKAVSDKETELAQEAEATEKAKKEALKGAFKYKDKHYQLTDRCPKTLKVLDTVYKKSELLKNKEAMEFLIVGGSGFVTQIN